MNDEAAFLQAMQRQPDDTHLRLVFADWLDERGDLRGELIRLLHTLTQSIEVPNRNRLEVRLRCLLASGVQPIGPFVTNSLGMKFAWIPAGTFRMGSPETEEERSSGETQHPVLLTRGFYLAIHPVTRFVWQTAMGEAPRRALGAHHPVEGVSREDRWDFFRLACERERGLRLPTEAEWEFACRAGSTTPFYFGRTCNGEQANCRGDEPYGTDVAGPKLLKSCPVGSYLPNAFGLHDMHGNVWEWCADFYGEYPTDAVTNPQGPRLGEHRVIRGGSGLDVARDCRAAHRSWSVSGSGGVGFRVAFRPE